MTPLVTLIIIFCLSSYTIFALIDFIRFRKAKRLMIEVVAIVLCIFLLNRATGFPVVQNYVFGGPGIVSTIVLLFICVILGMVANYFFHLKRKFSWVTLTKPLFVSPIILLPLIGTVNYEGLEPVQLISLLFLAFQNGFFWKEIFNKVQIQQSQNNPG